MKILHVLQTPRAEGTVKLALDWLAEPGLEQEVYVLNTEPQEMSAELRARAKWYDSGGAMPRGPAKYPWIMRRVSRVCHLRRPEMVLCWTNGFSPWVLAGARLAGVRKLVTHAGNPPTLTVKGKIQTMFSTLVAWVTGGRMVCCSQYVASHYARSLGVVPSVIRVVLNCAPVTQIASEAARSRRERRDHRPRLIMVATLESHKDHATLLRAMPVVVRAVPTVQLDLAGQGSRLEILQELSRSLGLAETVNFLGSRRDVPALLGASDVFVFSTTREEGLGTVLVEAMAAGLPVVASDVPACREVLAAGQWGRLVPAGDAEALAQALIESLQARHARKKEDVVGDHLQQFLPARMMAAYLATVS